MSASSGLLLRIFPPENFSPAVSILLTMLTATNAVSHAQDRLVAFGVELIVGADVDLIRYSRAGERRAAPFSW